MKDTPAEMARRFQVMLMARTGEERIKMGCSMHESARRLVLASVLAKNPRATSSELRRAFFLRFYRNDFDSQTTTKILQFLEDSCSISKGVI